MFIINFCLNLFRVSLCPSSGEQRPCYCIWCVVLVLLDVVGSGCGALRHMPSHGTIRTAHTTYAAALKTTTHPKTRCRKPYAAAQHLMLLMIARHHPHPNHDLRNGSQDHHPSKNSMQKTISCNSTSNAPDDGRIYQKHVELRIHQ